MSDETCSCQRLSIQLTAFLSSSDDLAVLTGPCKERRHREQLRQSDGINGIHSPIFGHQSKCAKRRPICKVARKVRCVYLHRDTPAAHQFHLLGGRASAGDQRAADRIGGSTGRAQPRTRQADRSRRGCPAALRGHRGRAAVHPPGDWIRLGGLLRPRHLVPSGGAAEASSAKPGQRGKPAELALRSVRTPRCAV
jgi:hypothetical protein